MSFSLFARKCLACFGLCLAGGVATVLAQANFVPQNGEYAIAGALPGAQVTPDISVNARGGYVVWRDNATDGDGYGISARPLDSTLLPIASAFRVNGQGAGDQENPRVALLDNGGAVFVWQGGQQGFQHIYARFLSSDNTWRTPDVMVNSSTNYFQVNPAVAVLADGKVVVVWSSFGQQGVGSMQDVFGQLFTPDGEKIGGEFPINQYTPYNQRTPAVAALQNGGFVVAWVSEQQQKSLNVLTNQFYGASGTLTTNLPTAPTPSVGIYARLFNANALPTLNEFQVNSSSKVCANPSVAGGADGGFMAVWGEADTAVPNNGWDVFAAHCSVTSPNLVSVSPESYVNTQLYGDQFAPQISSVGTNYMVVWTSQGQGVFGQFLNENGSRDGGEFQVNTANLNFGRYPVATVAGDDYDRFVVAWPSLQRAPGSIDVDLRGQIYANTNFVAPDYVASYAAPAFTTTGSTNQGPASVGGGGGGSLVLTMPDSTVLVPSGSVSNFQAAAGNYAGLFYNTNGVTVASSGYFSANVTAQGAYTASLVLGAHHYGFSGQLDLSSGQINQALWGTGLSVSLNVDLAGGDEISGVVKGPGWIAQLEAYKYQANTEDAGRYTMVMNGTAAQTNSPACASVGILSVNGRGLARWHAALADGLRVSQSGLLSKQGIWPLYASLYGDKGLVLGWSQISTNQDLSGQIIWIKPSGQASVYYPAGFTNSLQVAGSIYDPTKVNNMMAGGTTNTLTLTGGELGQTSLTGSLAISPQGRTTQLSGPLLRLHINSNMGAFSGQMWDAGSGGWLRFQGVILENGGIHGRGYFSGRNESGTVDLNIAP